MEGAFREDIQYRRVVFRFYVRDDQLAARADKGAAKGGNGRQGSKGNARVTRPRAAARRPRRGGCLTAARGLRRLCARFVGHTAQAPSFCVLRPRRALAPRRAGRKTWRAAAPSDGGTRARGASEAV